MERVKKGEKYWYIYFSTGFGDNGISVLIHAMRFAEGNYFHTKEEAEAMAEKICKVLKGAIVIDKLPSEEEMHSIEVKDMVMSEFFKESHEDLDMIMHGRHAYWKGWNAAIRWLKSQLTKEE